MTGRSLTPEQKRAVIERILHAWEQAPELRLGQFLVSAADQAGRDAFYVEDEAMADMCENEASAKR
jgi:uncharacterized protein YihD (DUF1040 family)